MILENGRVYTLDPSLPQAAAIAITRDGRVARGVEAWEGDRSEVSPERIDLDGRVVVPGFVDAHVHFLAWALARQRADLSGCGSLQECLAAVVDAAAARTDGWIRGDGWRAGILGDGPDAAALDAVTGDRPAALWAHDRHSLWLNSAGLAAAGIGRDTATVPGGVIERWPDGTPTGILRENAAWAIDLPEPGDAAALQAVAEAQRAAHAQGVTGVHDFQRRRGFTLWQRLHADRRLTLRVVAARPAEALDGLLETEVASGFGDRWLRIGPVKGFVDGTLGSHTAAMRAPYPEGGTGLLLLNRSAIEELLARTAPAGLGIALHAIGDAAVETALDAIEAAGGRADGVPPPRLEHVQFARREDLERMARLGVVGSVQPTHALSDRDVADALFPAPDAVRYPLRSLHAAGAALAFGSDAPIEPIDPLAGLLAATRRTTGDREPWHPEECLDPLDALAGWTVGAAHVAGDDGRGRLTPGSDADLVVLDADPIADPDRLGSTRVIATMVGGRWVHGRPPW